MKGSVNVAGSASRKPNDPTKRRGTIRSVAVSSYPPQYLSTDLPTSQAPQVLSVPPGVYNQSGEEGTSPTISTRDGEQRDGRENDTRHRG